MRGALALLLGLAVLAAPAQAQKLPVKPPVSKSATAALLRGTVDPTAPAEAPATPNDNKAPAPAPPPALPALLAPLAPAPAQDASRCRLTCASNYYFCLANDGSDDCPVTWGQCRAACSESPRTLDPPAIPAV